MERSSFFGSVNHDRAYKSADWARYFASFIGNGVFVNPLSNLQVVSDVGMNVKLRPGRAWINGYFYENTDDLTVALPMAHGSLNRVDRIVIQWNLALRSISATVNSSSPSVNPVAPDVQRDADIHEICSADILVTAGATSITQLDITDCRFDPYLCGIVSGLIDQIDTSDFQTQLDSWILSYQQNKDADFMTWFSFLQDTLDTNQAGNLASLILALTSRVDGLDGRADTIDSQITGLDQTITDLSNQTPITQTAYDNLVSGNLDVTGRVYYILEA